MPSEMRGRVELVCMDLVYLFSGLFRVAWRSFFAFVHLKPHLHPPEAGCQAVRRAVPRESILSIGRGHFYSCLRYVFCGAIFSLSES